MADLKDKYGNLVYRMEGNRIIDKYGNWKYEIRGEYIFDTYGNRKFEIRGEWLHDTYGNRLGEMKNLVDFLDTPSDSSNSTTSSQMPERKKPEGFFEWAVFIIGWLLYPYYENIRYFKYTATRREWWGTLGRMFLLAMALVFIGLGRAKYGPLIVNLVPMTPIILVSIRRMHDLDKSSWWILVPIYSFILCGFVRGKD